MTHIIIVTSLHSYVIHEYTFQCNFAICTHSNTTIQSLVCKPSLGFGLIERIQNQFLRLIDCCFEHPIVIIRSFYCSMWVHVPLSQLAHTICYFSRATFKKLLWECNRGKRRKERKQSVTRWRANKILQREAKEEEEEEEEDLICFLIKPGLIT